MFRHLLTVLLIFCATSACFAGKQEVRDATCKIYAGYGGDEWYTGTGFVYHVDSEKVYVMTAGHVIDKQPKKILAEFGGKKLVATRQWFISENTEHDDLGIIAIDRDLFDKVPKPLRLARPDYKPIIGTSVWTFGYGGGEAGEFDSVIHTHGPSFIQTMRVVEKGRSGSALYDEDADRVIGVIIRTDGHAVSPQQIYKLTGWK